MAVSLITGRIVYISDQAATILNCKRHVFKNAKFVEFLTPQDVSVFYSFTTPYRLPSWSMCTGAGTTCIPYSQCAVLLTGLPTTPLRNTLTHMNADEFSKISRVSASFSPDSVYSKLFLCHGAIFRTQEGGEPKIKSAGLRMDSLDWFITTLVCAS